MGLAVQIISQTCTSHSAGYGGVIFTPLRGGCERDFPQAPLTYALAPHVRLPGGLQMIASSRRTALNGILTFIPDGGDDPNHMPSDLLPQNARAHPRPAPIHTSTRLSIRSARRQVQRVVGRHATRPRY